MEQLLMSAEQLNTSLSDMSYTNPGQPTSYSLEDVNGNPPTRTNNNTTDSRETVFTTNSAGLVDAGNQRQSFPFPVRSGAAHIGAAEGWCSNLKPPGGRRPVSSDAPPAPPLPPVLSRVKRQHGETSGAGADNMITFSPPETPVTFTASRQPEGASRTDMAANDFKPPPTSLVLTAASPTPSAANPTTSASLAGRGRQSRQLVPHQSAGEPFWFPSPGTLRTIQSIQCSPGGSGTRSSMESGTGNDPRFVPDLRSIASGALVDIEIPSSYAGSCVSITGSQTTLLSSASPYKRGSVRRSLSADSMFSVSGKASSLGECPAPLVVLPGSNRTPTMEDPAPPLMMKRTTSLDQLRMLSPYPMPPLSCFVSPKTAAMVRSLSLEERASLALSMDEPICRICWQGVEAEECIQPCYCSTHVHQSCVQRWLGVAKITYCEVCRYQYKAIRKMKPLAQWRWWPNKNRHLAQLEATIILLGVVTPPLLCGIILCSQKIAEYLKTPDNAWKTAGLMTLVMISVGTYLGALLYFCHKFTTVCKIWANSNRTTVVTVVPLTPAQRRPKLDPCRVWSIS